MAGTIVNCLALLSLSAGLIVLAWVISKGLTTDSKQRQVDRWLVSWSIKGLLIPFVIWGLMNIGLSWRLQPFMPQIQAAQHSGGPWIPDFLQVLVSGLWISASYWAAVTLAWFVAISTRDLEPGLRGEFRTLCWACSLGFAIPAGLVGYYGGWPWLGVAALLITGPIARYSRRLVHPVKMPPIYARAIARMKFGKYSEAEWEIIRELEKCEDDFEGWMLLADLYANHFRDLIEAERTIRDICAHPKVNASQLAVALHRLADWQLKLGENPAAARRALQMIADRLSGTHLARMAVLRMNQIPSTVEELREGRMASTIPLPALGDALDKRSDQPVSKLDRKRATQLAEACVQRLRQDPDNAAIRERLARIFAERMDRSELGIEQIELLLGMPGQPDPKRAEWLGLIAAWQLKYRHNLEGGRRILEKVVREFPQSPQALAAKRRLEILDREGVPGSWVAKP